MTYRTIFAPIMRDATAETVARGAMALARLCNAHVMGVHLRQKHAYYPPVAYYPMDASVMALTAEKHTEAASQFARAMRDVFERICDEEGAHLTPLSEALKQNGVTASWGDTYGVLPRDLGRYARIADVSVFQTPGDSIDPLETDLFESLLLDSGRPVLLLPPSGLNGGPSRALVAWDGSQQSARAVTAALPLLDTVHDVRVVTLGEPDIGAPNAEAAAGFLRRHGVLARGETLEDGGQVADRLMAMADENDAELIVLGGYSHSRVHEALLGGVTRHMVRYCKRPMLMTH